VEQVTRRARVYAKRHVVGWIRTLVEEGRDNILCTLKYVVVAGNSFIISIFKSSYLLD